jgi:tRNA-modifying protein YgfZ
MLQDTSTPDMFSLEQYRALRNASALVDRSSRGRIRVTGQDRRDYLQGLLTNDVAALLPGTGCYAALLTAQGRMISDMYVVETGDAILMDLERDVTARVAAHLDQFIFSEDAQVRDVSDEVSQIGVFGPKAADVLALVLDAGSVPIDLASLRPLSNVLSRFRGTGVLVVSRDDAGVHGFDLITGRETAMELAAAARAAGVLDAGEDAVEVCRVESGHPVFHKDMDEDTIPLEAGIEDRAISQTKGCYVGQEIIIRVLHRGQGRVARRLVGLALDPSADVPARGDRIRAGARDIGHVTSAVRSVALRRALALGYVHRAFVEPSTELSIASGDAVHRAVVTKLPVGDDSELRASR